MMPNGQYCQMQCFHSCVYIEKTKTKKTLILQNVLITYIQVQFIIDSNLFIAKHYISYFCDAEVAQSVKAFIPQAEGCVFESQPRQT